MTSQCNNKNKNAKSFNKDFIRQIILVENLVKQKK